MKFFDKLYFEIKKKEIIIMDEKELLSEIYASNKADLFINIEKK